MSDVNKLLNDLEHVNMIQLNGLIARWQDSTKPIDTSDTFGKVFALSIVVFIIVFVCSFIHFIFTKAIPEDKAKVEFQRQIYIPTIYVSPEQAAATRATNDYYQKMGWDQKPDITKLPWYIPYD